MRNYLPNSFASRRQVYVETLQRMKARTLRRVTSQQIPKHLHVIWVGEDKNCPDKRIATWKDMHPSWEFTLWGNSELHSLPWRAKKQINIFIEAGFWDGVADLMRYEILTSMAAYTSMQTQSVSAP